MTDHISPKQVHDSLGVEDWRAIGDGACAYSFERAEARIAAALAAGGRMVRDEFFPAWWTLADAVCNEADIATTMGRD